MRIELPDEIVESFLGDLQQRLDEAERQADQNRRLYVEAQQRVEYLEKEVARLSDLRDPLIPADDYSVTMVAQGPLAQT